MANYVPKVANTSNELDEILKEKPHVILINNSDILPAIKKIVKKSKKEARSSKNWKTVSKLLVVGGLLLPGVNIVVGLGMAAIGVSSWRSRNRELNKNLLSKYEYLDTDETAYLILIKTKGENTFDTDSDIIDLDSLGKE